MLGKQEYGKQQFSFGLFVLCVSYKYGFENQFVEIMLPQISGNNHTRSCGDPKGRLKSAQAQESLDDTVSAHVQKNVHTRVATTPAIHGLDLCGSADPGSIRRKLSVILFGIRFVNKQLEECLSDCQLLSF